MRKLLARAAILLLPLITVFGVSSAAGASADPVTTAGQDPVSGCHTGAMCFMWDRQFFSNNSSNAAFGRNVWDHMYYRFPHNGRGGGERIGNNSGSFWNLGASWQSVTVYYNPSYNGARPSGPSQYYAPGDRRNCAEAGPYICNNNRAHFFN